MKLFAIMVVTILVSGLVSFSTMNAYAFNCESKQTGFWDVVGTWTNCGDGVPGDNDNVTIKNGHIVTIRTDLHSFPLTGISLTIEKNGELVMDGPSEGSLQIISSTFSNFGKLTLNGGPQTSTFSLGIIRTLLLDGTNECTGIINANGFTGVNSGSFIVSAGGNLVNKGIMNLNGGVGGSSGALGLTSNTQVDNHGTINESPGSGTESGIVRVISNAIFNDNLADLCPSVGGELLPIDNTALLIAGLQTSAIWMLPVLAGAAGVGAYYIKTRMNKE